MPFPRKWDIFYTRQTFFGRKNKGPSAYEEAALLNRIKKLPKPNPKDLKKRSNLEVSLTSIAVNHLKCKTLWFSERKKKDDSGFQSDYIRQLPTSATLLHFVALRTV